MLIAVLALGGTILGATTIAGFLMVYQIRQTSDFEDSAKAVFAADAGTEWALYSYYVNPSAPLLGFGNDATSTVTCSDAGGDTVSCGNPSSTQVIAKGSSGDVSRAFLLNLVP